MEVVFYTRGALAQNEAVPGANPSGQGIEGVLFHSWRTRAVGRVRVVRDHPFAVRRERDVLLWLSW